MLQTRSELKEKGYGVMKIKIIILQSIAPSKIKNNKKHQKNVIIPSMKRGIWQNPKTTRIANSTYDCLAAWLLILWDRLFLSRGESFCRRWIVTNVLMLNATIRMNGMNAVKWKIEAYTHVWFEHWRYNLEMYFNGHIIVLPVTSCLIAMLYTST